MVRNGNLVEARRAKNDEFYTRIEDIGRELSHYGEQLRDKIVYCNCDDPGRSNFWKYFCQNFFSLGLKKLVLTYYSPDDLAYKSEYTGDDMCSEAIGDGDFRSDECIGILRACDIVVTNPPFSLFREYVAQLMLYDKKFIIIGSMNAITYRDIFPLLKDNRMWLGHTSPKSFIQPDGTEKSFGNILWYTNVDIGKRHEPLPLFCHYTRGGYPKYDNYGAVNVDRVADIPCDYYGAMGVLITFLNKYCPEQFEICGLAAGCSRASGLYYDVPYAVHPDDRGGIGIGIVNGERRYPRILIKRK